MTDASTSSASLSPEQQALLEQLLADEPEQQTSSARARVTAPTTAPGAATTSGPAALSPTQARLWVSGDMAPNTAFGNLPLAFRVRGAWDHDSFTRAVIDVVSRHALLRTWYPVVSGERRQVVAEHAVVNVPEIDAASWSAALEAATALALRPFVLDREPPLRAQVWRAGDDDRLVLLVTHHLATDGWGVRILLREIAAALRGEALPPPAGEDLYALWADRVRAADCSPEAAEALQFWSRALAGAPSHLRLPARAAPGHAFAAHTVGVDLDEHTTTALRTAARAHGTTVYATLLAAYPVMLHAMTGEADLLAGTIISDRSARELETVVGNFGNNLYLRTTFDSSSTFTDLIRAAHAFVIDAHRYSSAPLEALAESRHGVRCPRFQVMFIMRDAPLDACFELPGASVEELTIEVSLMPMDLDLDLTDCGATIRGFLAARCAVLSRSDTEACGAAYVALAAALAGAPDRPVTDLIDALRRDGRIPEPWSRDAAPVDDRAARMSADEQRMAQLWREFLVAPDLAPGSDFYDLGGNSLIAARLFASIERAFGVDLPLATLLHARTVRDLTAEVADRRPATSRGSDGLIVEMNASAGSGTPLFLVAGAFGSPLNLRELAEALAGDRAVYGLRLPGLLRHEHPLEAMDDLVDRTVNAVRKVRPCGPYLLGGFCTGGTIAYAAATRMTAEGDAVEHVVLLDAPARNTAVDLSWRDRIGLHRTGLRHHGLSYPMRWLRSRATWELERARRAAGSEPSDDSAARAQAVFDATVVALTNFRPARFNGSVSLWRPPLAAFHRLEDGRLINSARNEQLPDNGWSPFAPELELHEIAAPPGDHDAFVESPILASWIDRLRTCLRTMEEPAS